MRLLLDTHAFLWFVTDDPNLSPQARTTIADSENDVLVSPASFNDGMIMLRRFAAPGTSRAVFHTC